MESFSDRLLAFPLREEKLRSVTRYSLYTSMWYRTDLWAHSRRVSWIVEEISPFVLSIFPQFDPVKARVLALVHDDPEIIFGDVQAGNKSKMSSEELAQLKKKERAAIDAVVDLFADVLNPELYKALLLEVFEKRTLEAMVVDWADKYDAFGEALHEVYAGNPVWGERVVNEYGTIPLPTEYYMNYFSKFTHKFPPLLPLFTEEHPLFRVPDEVSVPEVLSRAAPHTSGSVKNRVGYIPYDFWVSTTMTHGSRGDVLDLYIRKE